MDEKAKEVDELVKNQNAMIGNATKDVSKIYMETVNSRIGLELNPNEVIQAMMKCWVEGAKWAIKYLHIAANAVDWKSYVGW